MLPSIAYGLFCLVNVCHPEVGMRMVGLSDRVAFALPPKTKEDNVVGLNIYVYVCVSDIQKGLGLLACLRCRPARWQK